MDNSTVIFTTPETSTNSTAHYISVIDSLNICIFGISFIFGLPTHSYVIWLIVTGTGSGVAAEFFNLNLSVCELCICLNCFVYAMSFWFFSLSTVKQFFVGLNITGRPLFQSLICVERYLAVVHPVTFLKYKPLRYRVICCSVAWMFTLCSCLFCLYTLHEEYKYLYIYAQFLPVQLLIYVSIQLFCLVTVLRALKQSGPGERKREEENHMKKRAFYFILITTASMAIIYDPYTVVGFVVMTVKENADTLWLVGFTCYMLVCLVHPVLYLHRARKLCFYLP